MTEEKQMQTAIEKIQNMAELELLEKLWLSLTNEQREYLVSLVCPYCGCRDKKCLCHVG